MLFELMYYARAMETMVRIPILIHFIFPFIFIFFFSEGGVDPVISHPFPSLDPIGLGRLNVANDVRIL